MIFHTIGEKSKSAVLLIHGMLTPRQIWDTAAEHFSKEHYVIVPELDAHTLDEPSTFTSVENEAEKIRQYLMETTGGKLFLLAGLSMGGRIAAELAAMPGIETSYLILDGAPLSSMSGLLKGIMKANYKSIIRSSKKRDPKVLASAKKEFLPERFIPDYLKVADHMEETSIDNMIDSVFAPYTFRKYSDRTKILFMHGTKGNEAVAKKAALKLKKINPQTKINCYQGYAHAQLACFEPEKWVEEIDKWIKAEKKGQ
ncbi:MAG: alpha/beta hydrolase [Lachnospiraceae bacterium]|nr:alpha/beta hydrolase [Lachnospiraceae bacterium]